MASYRDILPDMAALGGNSRNTQEVAYHLANKLNDSEMNQFKVWLRQVKNQTNLRVQSEKKKFGPY